MAPSSVKNVARCEGISTLNVKLDAKCEKITLNVKNRFSKCTKHFTFIVDISSHLATLSYIEAF